MDTGLCGGWRLTEYVTREDDNVLVLFDFDKTLITVDSFRLFVRTGATSLGDHLRAVFSAVLCRAGFLSNRQYKEHLLRRVWGRRSPEDRTRLLARFLESVRRRQDPVVVRRLLDHVRDGHRVVVMSASPEFYLGPIVHGLSERVEVYGSRVTVEDTRVDVENLHGEPKAERARALIGERRPDRVHVYTDHAVDLPLLRLADFATLVRPSRKLLCAVRQMGLEFETIP